MFGCQSTFIQTSWQHAKNLDYTKLFEIALDLSSPERSQNVIGLGKFIGDDNAVKAVSWFDATLLAWEAAETIIDGIRTRDVKVMEVVNRYERDVEQ